MKENILFKLNFEILIFCILFVGCVSVPPTNYWAKSCIGKHIDELREIVTRDTSDPRTYKHKINWEEKTYGMENGNWVYVLPNWKGCFVHFEVNRDGIIVGYRLEGDRCH